MAYENPVLKLESIVREAARLHDDCLYYLRLPGRKELVYVGMTLWSAMDYATAYFLNGLEPVVEVKQTCQL